MSWKKNYQKLYDSTKKKIRSPSEAAFDKILQRKSNKLGLASSEAALVVLAAEEKVGYSRDLRKLNETQQNRVAQIIQNLNTGTPRVSDTNTTRISKKKTIKTSVEIGSDFEDPYLSKAFSVGIPYEGYAIMFTLENSIRNFIIRILKKTHGDKWWNQVATKKSLEDIVKKVGGRKTNEAENWYHSKRGVHEIFYTDYLELLQIIRALNADFQAYFRKGPEKLLLDELVKLGPSRNVIAHNNPITKDDLDRLKTYAKDWFKYMQHLKNTNS